MKNIFKILFFVGCLTGICNTYNSEAASTRGGRVFFYMVDNRGIEACLRPVAACRQILSIELIPRAQILLNLYALRPIAQESIRRYNASDILMASIPIDKKIDTDTASILTQEIDNIQLTMEMLAKKTDDQFDEIAKQLEKDTTHARADRLAENKASREILKQQTEDCKKNLIHMKMCIMAEPELVS